MHERGWAIIIALTETTDELQISAKIGKRMHLVRSSVHIPCVHSLLGDLRFPDCSMCFEINTLAEILNLHPTHRVFHNQGKSFKN